MTCLVINLRVNAKFKSWNEYILTQSLLSWLSFFYVQGCVCKDWSKPGNPGPTGAGAVVYLNGYRSSPILVKKGVSPLSNNYTGELVGIQIALEFIIGLEEQLKDTRIHVFTDCQPAIKAAFNGGIPSGKVDIILQIKECVNCLSDS